jgi:two-component system chemotaxis sensor kinase CheA
MDLSRYVGLFLAETAEHVSALNGALLALETEPASRESVEVIFRAVHTLKGMAATMGYAGVAELAHEVEAVLEPVRRGEHAADAALIALLFESADALEQGAERAAAGEEMVDFGALVARLRGTGTTGGGNGSGSGNGDTAGQGHGHGHGGRTRQVRVELRRLDALTDQVGELVILRDRLARAVAAAPESDELGEVVAEATRMIGELRDEVMRVRMVPMQQVLDRFPRLVRDTARGTGKQVDFAIEGGEIEFDRSMLDELGEPLIHLLRNSIDHGLESPAERRARGKSEVGVLRLSAARERSRAVIRVEDDGRGIDRARVVERAIATGLVTNEEAADLEDGEVLMLLTRPGFSTAREVTTVSGRGVGLDVVATRVRSLGGTLEIESEPGRGTRFTLRLPLTLAITRALLVRLGAERYAIPLAHVVETLECEPAEVRAVGGRRIVWLRGDALPLLDLRAALGSAPAVVAPEWLPVVVAEVGEREVGISVDALLGQQEIVVKSFDAAPGTLPVFSGATILPDGRPALVVDLPAIIARSGRAPGAAPAAAGAAHGSFTFNGNGSHA